MGNNENNDILNLEKVNKLLEGILVKTDYKANDIFLKEDNKISIKIDGEIIITKQILSRNEIMSFVELLLKEKGKDSSEFYNGKDIDLSYSFKGKHYDKCSFRINMFYALGKITIVIRVLQIEIPQLKNLKIPNKYIEPLLKLSDGLVLIVGSTGSGKTTTIAGLIDYYNENRKKHILTLEDPVEYEFENKNSIINQREVGTDTKSYSNGMKASLREAPDIVMIGEIRDLETLQSALKMAETGHLVISTLHTKGCVSTINRILQLAEGVPGTNNIISSALRGVIFQKLLRKKNGGRVIALESLYNNNKVSQAINDGKVGQITQVMETSRDEGMILFNTYIKEHIIPLNEVDGEELKRAMNRQ